MSFILSKLVYVDKDEVEESFASTEQQLVVELEQPSSAVREDVCPALLMLAQNSRYGQRVQRHNLVSLREMNSP